MDVNTRHCEWQGRGDVAGHFARKIILERFTVAVKTLCNVLSLWSVGPVCWSGSRSDVSLQSFSTVVNRVTWTGS